jgi:4-hydroxybenzoyl-CoA thioesterase
MNTPLCTTEIRVSFGDCDPAGIVYYPNFFRWADGLFHLYLQGRAEGHQAVCQRIGSLGLGLMSAGMQFRSPVAPGQILSLSIVSLVWSERSFEVQYAGAVDGRQAISGTEKRAVFMPSVEWTCRGLVPLL